MKRGVVTLVSSRLHRARRSHRPKRRRAADPRTTRIDDRRRRKVTRNLVERISIRLDDEGPAGRDLRRR
jgi:hypothetical protein